MEIYLQIVHRVVYYLKGSPSKEIIVKKGVKVQIEAYTDVDYSRLIVDIRSTIGRILYIFCW